MIGFSNKLFILDEMKLYLLLLRISPSTGLHLLVMRFINHTAW